MLNRKISVNLDNWFHKTKKKALIIEGPRQVGKTFIINDYISKHYDEKYNFSIDLKVYPSIGNIFDRGYDSGRIYQEVKLRFPDKNLEEGKSILFFDNVQMFPKVIEYLRYFTEDAKYDVIVAGSSLGVIYHKMKRFPVGYVERYQMNGLDFTEYLWASGYDQERIDYVISLYLRYELGYSALHDVFLDLFREYMTIGGMPLVVSEYLKQKNFKLAFNLQKKIIDNYYADFANYGKTTMVSKITDCFNSIPKQLDKENKKFQYKIVSSKARASLYENSVKWLIDSGIVFPSYNLMKPVRPLTNQIKSNTFKLYINDPGLLCSMYGEKTQLEILKGDVMVHNGAILENAVARILYDNGLTLYYYECNSTLNVDFIVSIDRIVTPLVLKEADNPKSKILASIHEKFQIDSGKKLSFKLSPDSDYSIMPVYMVMLLK